MSTLRNKPTKHRFQWSGFRASNSQIGRRLAWNIFPALMIMLALWLALGGEDGLLQRHALKQRLMATQSHVDQLQVENSRLQDHLEALRTNPVAVRRVAAERLLAAEAGATIYRFEEPSRP